MIVQRFVCCYAISISLLTIAIAENQKLGERAVFYTICPEGQGYSIVITYEREV